MELTTFEIGNYVLVLTCGACPEQYDVYKDNIQVGYLRLRHGYFRAEAVQYNDEIVYDCYPKGDGIFENEERKEHLLKAIKSLDEFLLIKDLAKYFEDYDTDYEFSW